MMWADAFVDEIQQRFSKQIVEKKPLIIRDEKTLSGPVHIGSVRGIVIHGVIAQILHERGISNDFLFELNDFDPMDGLPQNLDEKTFKPHMGKPLCMVPPHEGTAENYPMVFGEEMKKAVAPLGLPIEYYTLKPLYMEGKFNDCIRDALDNAATIRKIYLEVSGGAKPDDWLPVSMICENCGKVGTTQATAWDGEKVTYVCRKNMVKWADGCEHTGTVSPFDGNAKLPWKVEWAAKWKVVGVHIEGAGKDHYAAGGSREIARRITEEVFNYPEPFNIPYEFFNFKGKKMSASKGIGATAAEISSLLPPHLLKLMMIRKEPNQPIDFDPEGKTVPNLFDEYDRLADHFFKRHAEPFEAFARIFQLAHIDLSKPPKDLWQMRFSTLVFIVQMPHLSLEGESEKLKGSSLSEDEKSALSQRAEYVKKWLDAYAPDSEKFQILESTPQSLELDDEQKIAFAKLCDAFADSSLEWDGAKIHECIHAVKTENEISPKKVFQPLYQMFLGRNEGPQIGWFLSTFAREDVIKRIRNVL